MPSISVLKITSVSLAPNPVNINTPLSIAVSVTETTVTLSPEITYAGDCYSGEINTQRG